MLFLSWHRTVPRSCAGVAMPGRWHITSRTGRSSLPRQSSARPFANCPARLLSLAPSSLYDSQNRCDLFPGGGPQLVASLVNLGPVLLPDVLDLGLLLVSQVQVLEVRNSAGPFVAHALP